MGCLEYYNGGEDYKGRSWEDHMNMTDSELEDSHDVIQWLFPIDVSNDYFAKSSLLTSEEVEIMSNSSLIISRVILSFNRYVSFLGFKLLPDNIIILDQSKIDNLKQWVTVNNHNFRRISRVLICLRLLNLEELGCSLWRILRDIYHTPPFAESIGKTVFDRWEISYTNGR